MKADPNISVGWRGRSLKQERNKLSPFLPQITPSTLTDSQRRIYLQKSHCLRPRLCELLYDHPLGGLKKCKIRASRKKDIYYSIP